MLITQFKNQLEFDIYIAEQKIRQEKKWLTRSEREQLKQMIDNPKNYIKEEKELPKGKPIITNINILRKPCEEVKQGENIKEIIKDLKETLSFQKGLGLSANQIGWNKRISYIRFVIENKETKKQELKECILINPKIIERDTKIVIKESCLSLPCLTIDTDRYIYVTVTYLDENFKERTVLAQDMESFILQHEIAHLNGRTILNDKHRS